MVETAFEISTDRDRLDIDLIHRYLSEESYWAAGIPRETVVRSIEHSLPFGVYGPDGAMAGFARVITDYATFGYLADVFVLDAYRGKGLSKLLMEAIVNEPSLAGLRRWMLFTRDAHGLYAQFGFEPLDEPARVMQRSRPNPYQ